MTTRDQQPGKPPSAQPQGPVPLQATRRDVIPPLGAATVATLAALGPAAQAHAKGAPKGEDQGNGQEGGVARRAAPSRYVYVGTYTKPNTAPGGTRPSVALGIYVFKMDGATGALSQIQLVPNIDNPSWVALEPSLRNLYATSEVSSWHGQANTGGVTAFSVNASTGMLTRINDQPSYGSIPAVVTPDPTGKYIMIGNYVGATFAVLPIQAGGGVGPATDVFAATGMGSDPARQEAPHPHDVKFDPAGKFVFGPDLGTDKVWSWRLDLGTGKLIPLAPPYAQVASGSGPRHMSFHPSGKWAYVIDEMVSSVTAFRYDAVRGTFIWLQTISTLPPRFTGHSSTAEIIVHPSGKWVYGSNRGHNTIVVYEIDQTTGMLDPIEWQSTQGEIPRGFNIDPSGALLLAGNQNSDTIVPFYIHQVTGRLQPTGYVTQTPTPVCIQFGRVIGG